MSCHSSEPAIYNTRTVRRVAVLTHPRLLESEDVAAQLVSHLAALGVAADARSGSDTAWLLGHLGELDCVITLGGDGTIVRMARVLAGQGVPLLGVNLGQLGFLAELQPSELEGRLGSLARGEFRIEERALLRAIVTPVEGPAGTYDALNDATVARGEKVRVIAAAISIDGQPFTTYRADGVVVATPTGSTAYALAVGGPILAPSLNNLVVVPVAPHLVPTRALVLPGASAIRLRVCEPHQAVFSADGQEDRPLAAGDVVHITLSPKRVGFVRFGPPADFYGTLFRRLRWTAHPR